jgi:DNA-binding NarL/FixJ family response regulator
MARLTGSPVDVILADTAVTRPDSVGFTRRVLARSPHSTLVLFGPEDPAVAAAAVAAGARGVLRGADQDLVSLVAKALLLLLPAAAPPAATAAPASLAAVRAATAHGEDGDALSTVVPAQRSDTPGLAGHLGGVLPTGPAQPPGGRLVAGAALGGQPNLALGGARPGAPGADRRRAALTERELQVLRGMADGKSNAEIGRELFVSEDTVKTHARRLFRKLGARDRAHAVAAGFRSGLVA